MSLYRYLTRLQFVQNTLSDRVINFWLAYHYCWVQYFKDVSERYGAEYAKVIGVDMNCSTTCTKCIAQI